MESDSFLLHNSPMTYCLAMKLSSGLVFCSDSRTNAGADRVSMFSKMHRFHQAGERDLILLSAGNLGTTQAVVDAVDRDIKTTPDNCIFSMGYISEVADYIGMLSRKIQQKYAPAGEQAGFDPEASFILGGQIAGEPQEMYLIYPEGNHIRPSERYPFFQIGETKYGRPILDRIIRDDTDPEIAMRCAVVSMDSTMRSNATVGPPVELAFLPAGEPFEALVTYKFEQNDPYLREIRAAWNDEIVSAFHNLPALAVPEISRKY